MPVSDPISDLLTRIRNAVAAQHPEVSIPHSKTKEAIARILESEGYVRDVLVRGDDRKEIHVGLKYSADQEPVIRGLRRESRPGLRRYVGSDAIPRVLGGMGLAVLSTSRGLMSGKDAKRAKIGGEYLCSIW